MNRRYFIYQDLFTAPWVRPDSLDWWSQTNPIPPLGRGQLHASLQTMQRIDPETLGLPPFLGQDQPYPQTNPNPILRLKRLLPVGLRLTTQIDDETLDWFTQTNLPPPPRQRPHQIFGGWFGSPEVVAVVDTSLEHPYDADPRARSLRKGLVASVGQSW